MKNISPPPSNQDDATKDHHNQLINELQDIAATLRNNFPPNPKHQQKTWNKLEKLHRQQIKPDFKKPTIFWLTKAAIFLITTSLVITSFLIFKQTWKPQPTPSPTDQTLATDEKTIELLILTSYGVEIKTNNQEDWQPLNNRQNIPLTTNTSIRTKLGGQAIISFPGGTQTRINQLSQITLSNWQLLNDQQTITIDHHYGQTYHRIVSNEIPTKYQAKTPHYQITTLGTAFSSQIDDWQTTTLAISHDLLLTNNAQIEQLKQGQKITSNQNNFNKSLIQSITSPDLQSAWLQYNFSLDQKDGYDTGVFQKIF